MRKMEHWEKLRETILQRIIPDKKEYADIKSFTNELTDSLHKRFTEHKVSVEIHGSISRDTWIKGDKDIDVFLVMEEKYGKKTINRLLEAVKDFVGPGYTEAYAEHPYIQARINGYTVEFVPCYRIKPGEAIISSTDRTPLHTDFLKRNMRDEQRDEVRLLKQFMKGINVYGAEIRIKGFSGYLTELLIINYGGFKETLLSASSWKHRTVIQYNKKQKENELAKKFNTPLIVIDPVDPNRNVASSTSERTLWNFVAASKKFTQNPEKKYFFPVQRVFPRNELMKIIKQTGKDFLFLIVADNTRNVPDILWGQLYKTQEAVQQLLQKNGFTVLRSDTWSDEKNKHIFLFELESNQIPSVKKHIGPPVNMHDDSENFLKAHKGKKSTVSGPGIDGNRWWVQKRRRHTDARKLLENVVINEGDKIGISKGIMHKIKEKSNVLLNEEIQTHINEGFALHLTKFLKGGPDWLD